MIELNWYCNPLQLMEAGEPGLLILSALIHVAEELLTD